MRISDWSSDVCSSDLEGLGGAGVDGAVDGRRSGAVARQLVEEEARDRHRVFRLGEALLLHQGVALQPVHELGAGGGDHLGLREVDVGVDEARRSEEQTSELQSLMRISYAVFCLKKKKNTPD